MTPPPIPGFAPGQGRERPAHQARRITCANCNQQIALEDEHSRMVVCKSCGSQLEIGEAEARVLNAAAGRDPGRVFQLQLGDRFRYRGARYEIVGRLRYDEEESLPTCQYLLYNPRRGTLWLSEYMGHWDISRTSRVMPESDPQFLKKGDTLRTHDGNQWLLAGKGTYELGWVDGALPWVAAVGDRVDYAELVAADGSGETYEVELQRGGHWEQETARGRLLTVAEVREATGKRVASPNRGRENVAEISKGYEHMLFAAFVILLLNILAFFYFGMGGRQVLDQRFSAEELSGEVLSEPFEIHKDGRVLRYEIEAPLKNAWMSVDLALVRDGEEPTVVLVTDEDIEYYYGREGGESWSEGSKSSRQYLRAETAGTYRLLVRAVSGEGSQAKAERSELPLRVRVVEGVHQRILIIVSGLVSLLAFITVFSLHQQWRTADDEDL